MLVSKEVLRGYGFLVSYILLSTVSTVSYQFMARGVPDFEANGIRFAFGIIITGIMILIRKDTISIPIQQRCNVLQVAFVKLSMILFYFAAVSILPFTHVSAIALGLQGLWAALISKFKYGEPIKRHLLPISVCIAGMILVVQPWLKFSYGFIPKFVQTNNITNLTSQDMAPSVQTEVTSIVTIGYTLVLLASGLEALTMILISTKLRDVRSSTLVFIISCLAIPTSILLSLYLEEPILITDMSTLGLLLLHSVCIGLAIVMQFSSCQILDPTELSICCNLETLFLIVPQYTMTGTALYGRMNVLEGMGCGLIVLSLTLTVLIFRNGSHEDF